MSRSRRRQRKASRKPITISASSAASRPRTTLQSLNSDVLSAILDFLDRLDAIALASASRWIRRCCMPLVFQHCQLLTGSMPRTPPGAIGTHVHRLTIKGDYLPEDNDPGYFSVLAHLPSLSSVTFHYAFRGVPWMGVQACLKFPNITALSFTHTSQWLVPGRPEEYRWILDTLPAPGASGIPSRIPLTAFSYTTLVWRELREHSEAARFPHTATLAEEYAAEARGLAPLVPAMQDTAESLRLPLDTSPVQEMCEGYWPRLSDLSFRGSYPQSMPLSAMSTLLSRMPRLRNLSLEIAQPRSHSRAPIFGANAPKGCEYLPLRSLTVAYPDPDDAIFTSVGADLTRLSIRDWPRYYYPFRGEIDLKWSAPILSSSECLRLLTRMNVPHLRRLEVVYKVNGPDDDLLRHIATSYPDLEEFEIHRYRADNDKDEPPYNHIVRLLAPLKRLRRLRLNLDFDHQGRPLESQSDSDYRFALGLEDPLVAISCAHKILDLLHAELPGVTELEMLYQDGPLPLWRPCYLKDGACEVLHLRWVPSQIDSEWPLTDTDWQFIRFW